MKHGWEKREAWSGVGLGFILLPCEGHMELLHKDITEKIIGAAFEVHGILGYGFLEMVYQKAMQVELQSRGLK